MFQPWPKLFQNLRSTRETELLNEGWKTHQVYAWIGNSEPVAMEHYLRVTETDYAEAAAKAFGEDDPGVHQQTTTGDPSAESKRAQQNTPQDVGIEQQGSEQECENPSDYANRRDSLVEKAPGRTRT